LWVYLLPPPLPVQPVRRPGARDAPARQPWQRPVLAAGAAAGDRNLPGPRHPQVLPGRRGVRRPEAAAFVGAGRLPLRHPHQGQRGAGAENRRLAEAAGGTAVAPAQGLLLQRALSGWVVGPGPPGGG
jgi:hypothetical protein